ncbi:MAG: zf-HC2 domain-containing protein [Lawsonibacter sp.]
MLSCEEALEQMSQALDSPLTGEEQGELEAHLACCPACRADWAALRSCIRPWGSWRRLRCPRALRTA